MVFGLATAVLAWLKSDDALGTTTTDRLLVTTRPLAVAALGLVALAIGAVLAHLEHLIRRST